jgi:hypothetical protein
MKPEISIRLEMAAAILQYVIYLAIVGGVTRFRSGISSRAQRGWFMSWALIGTIYGCFVGAAATYEEHAAKECTQEVRILKVPRTKEDGWRGAPEVTGFFWWAVSCSCGAATIGGVIAMVQQYLHFVQC